MPVKEGLTASRDYILSKEFVYTSEIGQTDVLYIDNYKRVQKYLYEIGLKMKPRREFSTKKLNNNELRATRVI